MSISTLSISRDWTGWNKDITVHRVSLLEVNEVLGMGSRSDRQRNRGTSKELFGRQGSARRPTLSDGKQPWRSGRSASSTPWGRMTEFLQDLHLPRRIWCDSELVLEEEWSPFQPAWRAEAWPKGDGEDHDADESMNPAIQRPLGWGGWCGGGTLVVFHLWFVCTFISVWLLSLLIIIQWNSYS